MRFQLTNNVIEKLSHPTLCVYYVGYILNNIKLNMQSHCLIQCGEGEGGGPSKDILITCIIRQSSTIISVYVVLVRKKEKDIACLYKVSSKKAAKFFTSLQFLLSSQKSQLFPFLIHRRINLNRRLPLLVCQSYTSVILGNNLSVKQHWRNFTSV